MASKAIAGLRGLTPPVRTALRWPDRPADVLAAARLAPGGAGTPPSAAVAGQSRREPAAPESPSSTTTDGDVRNDPWDDASARAPPWWRNLRAGPRNLAVVLGAAAIFGLGTPTVAAAEPARIHSSSSAAALTSISALAAGAMALGWPRMPTESAVVSVVHGVAATAIWIWTIRGPPGPGPPSDASAEAAGRA